MITGFVGAKRSGKTLGMTARLYRMKLMGRKILTNYYCSFADGRVNAKILEKMADGELEMSHTSIGLHEVHTVLDPRLSATRRNINISYILGQTGKADVDLYFDTQLRRLVEVRLWENTEYLVQHPQRMGDWFRYRVQYGPMSLNPGKLKGAFRIYGPKYYPLYDTSEVNRDYQKPEEKKSVEVVKRPSFVPNMARMGNIQL